MLLVVMSLPIYTILFQRGSQDIFEIRSFFTIDKSRVQSVVITSEKMFFFPAKILIQLLIFIVQSDIHKGAGVGIYPEGNSLII